MSNHLAKFTRNLAEKTKPLRELLIKSNQWVWGGPQETAFTEVKRAPVQFCLCLTRAVRQWYPQTHHRMGWMQCCYRDNPTES